MKCDVCDAEATVFLTQIINGQMTTVNPVSYTHLTLPTSDLV